MPSNQSNNQSATSVHARGRSFARVLLTLLVLVAARRDSIAVADVEIIDVTVGFAERYRVGRWTPVHVTVQAGNMPLDGQLELVLPDGEGTESATVSRQLALAAGARDTITGYAKFGRVDGSLEAHLLDATGDVLASRRLSRDELPDAVLASQQLVITLGADVGVGQAAANRREKFSQETIHALVPEVANLPDRWIGYAGVSLVVLPGNRAGLAGKLGAEQLDALDRWVRLGGRLILCAGESGQEVLAAGGPLARFVPGRFDRVTMQRQTSGLEDFAGAKSQRLDLVRAPDEQVFRMPMTLLVEQRGRVEAYEDFGGRRTPTVIRSSHGFGQVVFVAVDLDQFPLSEWTGRARLLGRLLEVTVGPVPNDDTDRQYDQLTQIGFDDLIGQLRGALDQFSSVRLVPFSWIAVLIGGYIVLIGPVDYLVLRKLNRRFSWTWITFPLVVLAGCVMASVLTRMWKGDQLVVNQVDLVDIDIENGLLRGNTWSHIFSPASDRYDFELNPRTSVGALESPRGALLSWQGLPGKSFGGMNTSRLDRSHPRYHLICDVESQMSQEVQLAGMPIDVFSSRSLHGQYWGQIGLGHSGSLAADAENQLRGEFVNPLGVELRDGLLCYDRWAYPLGRISAGGSKTLGRDSKPKTITGLLTRSRVDQDFKGRSEPWNRQNLDLRRIFEIMMFHDAAGGTDYTSLLQRFQHEVDLSDHLRQGKAVFVGRSVLPATRISRNGDESAEESSRYWTFYRLLLPVTPFRR